ncbi:MAG TPA: helix-hairpin-helix domain-containing protein [Thermomicrobiales bacterium]|jgi:DNA polymerase (family 10)|nr:helix-hairpin-helix domain-containing protein [Thermomicrobiales bacterium]
METIIPTRRDRNDPTITPITVPNRTGAARSGMTSAVDAARMLRTIASLIEQTGGNQYRAAAYRRAATLLAESDRDLHSLLILGPQGYELSLPGLGDRLRRKLGELLTTGRMDFSIELQPTLPPAVRNLLAIRSVGPRTAQRLSADLGVTTVEEVVEAARRGHIRRLPGFGKRREKQILTGAEAWLAQRTIADMVAASDQPPTPAAPAPAPTPIRRLPARPDQLRLPAAA